MRPGRVPRALACLGLAAVAWATEPSPVARDEVQHLLAYLGGSGCQFFRNGSWHDAADAKAHLTRKYEYLMGKDLVHDAGDFIRLAATESSMSGTPYRVRCGGGEPVASATWLGEELVRYRDRRPAAEGERP